MRSTRMTTFVAFMGSQSGLWLSIFVGKDLFDKCIIDVLLKRKKKGSNKKRTVVLVTNALQYLTNPLVDRVVVMKDGRIVESGTYQSLSNNEGSHFRRYMNVFNHSMTSEKEQDKSTEANDDFGADDIHGQHGSPEKRKSTRKSDRAENVEKESNLMTDEMAEREVGKVDKEVYMTWARAAGGVWVVIPLFLIFGAGEAMNIFSNWWLTYWSHEATPDTNSQLKFLSIYALINFGAICVDFCRMFVILFLGLLASSSVSNRKTGESIAPCTPTLSHPLLRLSCISALFFAFGFDPDGSNVFL